MLENPVTDRFAFRCIKTIVAELARLKTIEQVDVPQDITAQQAAGWMDSDGCVALSREGQKAYTVAQKYPQILHAFQRTYGGTVRQARIGKYSLWGWRLKAAGTDEFLQDVAPWSVEKHEQFRIVANSTPATRAADLARLKQLKGHQVGRREIILLEGDIEVEVDRLGEYFD